MSTPTPETDDAARKGAYLTAGEYPETCGKQIVHIDFARKLERERDQLQRWKEEMLAVWKKWEAVEAVVRKHPDAILGQSISDTVLRFIKERDELSWIPVTERMPTEEDINAYGDVDWSDGKELWEGLYSRNDKGATHWRRIVLP